MAIKRDYKCEDHGFFEAWEPVCPSGCEHGINVVFLRAPAYMSSRTKTADRALKGMAKEFNMTNIKSTREGENQGNYITRNNAPVSKQEQEMREARPGDNAIWGGGGGISMANVMGGNAYKSVKGESVSVLPKDIGDLQGPRAASYMSDHEGLKIKP